MSTDKRSWTTVVNNGRAFLFMANHLVRYELWQVIYHDETLFYIVGITDDFCKNERVIKVEKVKEIVGK